mgnify:CR=1 FL=1
MKRPSVCDNTQRRRGACSNNGLNPERLSMKVCVVGAGGVGGLLAAVLRRAGVDVSLLVTERHLSAIRQKGLTLIGPDGQFNVAIQAETDPRAIGACVVSRHAFFAGLKTCTRRGTW